MPPPQEPLIGARIPTDPSLRRSDTDWLLNLSSRALNEVFHAGVNVGRLGLVLNLPESFRCHPGLSGRGPEEFLSSVVARLQIKPSRALAFEEGGAGAIFLLASAEQMLRHGEVDTCIIGGVDSLLNGKDIDRLRETHRLQGPEGPDGFIPGEGAAFILVSLENGSEALARILGVGSAIESDCVTGPRYSQGTGLVAAMQSAIHDSGMEEATVSLRVSNLNGERYAAWEAAIAVPRFYRTRRERLPVWYMASAVGDTGAASGALGMVLSAFGIAGGYAPGAYVMCEAASEDGLRAACLVGPARGDEMPPFRPEDGARSHIVGRTNQ
jgi:3-oxoacyl-[acyl-carrier-protein] synthase-1